MQTILFIIIIQKYLLIQKIRDFLCSYSLLPVWADVFCGFRRNHLPDHSVRPDGDEPGPRDQVQCSGNSDGHCSHHQPCGYPGSGRNLWSSGTVADWARYRLLSWPMTLESLYGGKIEQAFEHFQKLTFIWCSCQITWPLLNPFVPSCTGKLLSLIVFFPMYLWIFILLNP